MTREEVISREGARSAVCRAFREIYPSNPPMEIRELLRLCKENLELVHPVTPSRRKGHWIETEYHRWRCSVCREKGMSEWDNIHDVRTNFCPDCGAKMVEPQEIHCNYTDEEIDKSFIEDVEAVKDLLPLAESRE